MITESANVARYLRHLDVATELPPRAGVDECSTLHESKEAYGPSNARERRRRSEPRLATHRTSGARCSAAS